MIRGENVDRLAHRAGYVPLADSEPLRRQIFQAPQASQRFGERVETSLRLGQISFRRSDDGPDHFLNVGLHLSVHRASFR